MTQVLLPPTFLAASWLALVPAYATGSLGCDVNDASLAFSANSAVGRGMGGPIINLTAAVDIKLKDTPADLAKIDLSKGLVHSWLEAPDVRLHFYSEREGEKPHGYVELVIKTVVKDDEGTAEGDYALTVFYTETPAGKTDATTLNATGKITCFVE
jgi:hypothetical protein